MTDKVVRRGGSCGGSRRTHGGCRAGIPAIAPSFSLKIKELLRLLWTLTVVSSLQSMSLKKLLDFFNSDMIQLLDFELRPYRSNGSI
jgi:hypothetical protein